MDLCSDVLFHASIHAALRVGGIVGQGFLFLRF